MKNSSDKQNRPQKKSTPTFSSENEMDAKQKMLSVT